jgi:hypothetical protein
VVAHLDRFTGASATVNTVLVALVPAVFVAGLLLARRLRRHRHEVYERFAAEPDADADAEEPVSAQPAP